MCIHMLTQGYRKRIVLSHEECVISCQINQSCSIYNYVISFTGRLASIVRFHNNPFRTTEVRGDWQLRLTSCLHFLFGEISSAAFGRQRCLFNKVRTHRPCFKKKLLSHIILLLQFKLQLLEDFSTWTVCIFIWLLSTFAHYKKKYFNMFGFIQLLLFVL